MHTITRREGWLLRTRAHCLHPETTTKSASAAVSALCGVQAQEKHSALLSVRPRTTGANAADIDAALAEHRTLVRTWCMRGTLHLVASEDVRWLLSLFGPHFAPRGPEPKQLAEAGFGETELEHAMRIVQRVLTDADPLTRDELAARLREEGVTVDPTSREPNILVRQAALRGILCEVAPIDGENAYGLLEEWVTVTDPPAREDSLKTLAERYLRGYQPATFDDFAYWSGLPKRDLRPAWESIAEDTTEIMVGKDAMTMFTDDVHGDSDTADSTPIVRLLPGYDTSLLGYTVANRPVPAAAHERVWPGAGVIRPTLVVDGAVVGTWKLDRTVSPPLVRIAAFESFEADVRQRLADEVADIGRFLGIDAEHSVEEEPL